MFERKWRGMVRISHDFFFAWWKAAGENAGEGDAERMCLRFWEIIGETTARAYLERGRLDPGDLEGLVRLMARSSDVMGEEVEVLPQGDDWLLIHKACPWVKSYEEWGFGGKCQVGCDRWFQRTVEVVNPRFSVRTESSLPAGGSSCVRRFRTPGAS